MIVLSTDHRGYALMQKIKKYLDSKGYEYVSVGANSYDASDSYATYTLQANELVAQNADNRGIYLCGTGLGTCIGANRNKAIRAVLCNSKKYAYFGRFHNNANVLVMGAEHVSFARAKKMIDTFLTTPFEGGRHIARLEAISK